MRDFARTDPRQLLATTAIGAALGAALLFPRPALADCAAENNITCSWSSTGSAGTPAQSSGAPANGSGHDGGAGGGASDWTLIIDGLNWVGDGTTLTSPINLTTTGGAGAQGSDATAGLSGKDGGSGGAGGDGGHIGVTTGSAMTGSTASTESGITLVSQGGKGGAGAFGNLGSSTNGTGAVGGNGGGFTLDLDGDFPQNLGNTSRAIYAVSQGGAGGGGRDWKAGLNENGPDAGNGGNGGVIDATLRGTFIGNYGGVLLVSQGGTGGTGGEAENFSGAEGGDGGTGGNGGNVSATIAATANIGSYADLDAGLLVRSEGGTGGAGGSGPSGGSAGAGGNAGNVSLTVMGGKVGSYAGTGSPAILAQSLGGNGGSGGGASEFVVGPNGGDGGNGGSPGSVLVATGKGGSLVTIVSGQTDAYEDDYNLSPGVLAQSIGGGGGAGSNAKGWFAVGGSGGSGGGSKINGSSASVDLLANITTNGINSDGIAVQSIGGGGGKGGNAKGSSVEVQMTIGGVGGNGGDGGAASAQLRAGSTITTNDTHGHGIVIQSIGGGGGMGGAAYSVSHNGFYGASMALGGSGGDGGDGSTVSLVSGASATSSGRITTFGADSYGILGQSIGGGGGIGGASTATSKTYSTGDVPGLSLSMSMGGTGGSGGKGEDVTLVNAGLIATSGAGSLGMIGQSVGGGGGVGGDASSTSTATKGNYGFSAAMSFGGNGGGAGDGGTAEMTNNGFIITTGESADAMLVQSIGGGGGAGGAGDAKSSADGKEINASLAVGMGGKGGAGGDAYSVTAKNTSSLITLGDSAFGIGAQSIGGSGGRGGGAAASGTGDITLSVAVGGQGGNGGSSYHSDGGVQTGIVTVDNAKGATIVTFGADSNGIIAQSIGGGGGVGGKGATSLGTKKSTGDGGSGDSQGTPDTLSKLAAVFDSSGNTGLADYTGLNGAIVVVNSLLNNTTGLAAPADDDPDSALDDAAQSKGANEDDNDSTSIKLSVSLGEGGSGGGGGSGGTGGAGGYGGVVTVANTGTIYTKGALAAGIVAESISGGGGVGGRAASSIKSSSKKSGDDDADDGYFTSVAASIGGDGGTTFDSGQVTVTSSGAISTAAHDAIGIIAQSISGGGGIIKSIATDKEGAGGSASAKSTDFSVDLKFGGSASEGSAGYGSGYVNVTTQKGGKIVTKGDNAFGILAQSIAGGGGVSLGGKPKGTSATDFFGSGERTGSVHSGNTDPNNSASNSGLFVTVGDDITTAGKGAIAVVAQSIGGGGGISGDTGWTAQYLAMSGASNLHGNGGYIGIAIAAGATLTTQADNTPVIWAQSIGGGGGRITNVNGAFVGTAGGSGTGGAINIQVDGALQANGSYSAGVFAQSEGDKTSNAPISITVGSGGSVTVGTAANPVDNEDDANVGAAIYIDHGATGAGGIYNSVTNDGTITGYASPANFVAIYSTGGYTKVVNNGTLNGNVVLTDNGGQGCFTNNGTFNAGNTVSVGGCGVSNAGVFNVGRNGVGQTTITGNFTQTATGVLKIDADFVNGAADLVSVSGAATIGGTVQVAPTSVTNKALTVLTAAGGVTLDPALKSADSLTFYDFAMKASGNTLTITPQAKFTSASAGLGGNRQAVAANLQALFDGGASMDAGFNSLAKVGAADVDRTLDTLSGQAIGAIGAFRYASSRAFVGNLYNGCEVLDQGGGQGSLCTWAKFQDLSGTQDATADEMGYKASGQLYQIGLQTRLSPNLHLSGAVAYEHGKFHNAGRDAEVKGDAVLLGASLRYHAGSLEVSGAIDGAYGWYDSSRRIAVGGTSAVATGQPEQWEIGAHLHAAYTIVLGSVASIKPFADLHAMNVHARAFSESGESPFNLDVLAQSEWAVTGALGAELGGRFAIGDGWMLRTHASASVELNNAADWTTYARFSGQPQSDPFSVKTGAPDTLGRVAIGADFIKDGNFAISLSYSPEFGDNWHAHSAFARLAYRF